MFNGMALNKTGPQLQLQSVTESNSGDFTCMFHNNVTSRFSSVSKMIRIQGKSLGIFIFNLIFSIAEDFESFSTAENVTVHIIDLMSLNGLGYFQLRAHFNQIFIIYI